MNNIELRDNAIKFVNTWQPLVEKENIGERQHDREFMSDFYEVFGISRINYRQGFEFKVSIDGRDKRIDSLLPGELIIEMESQGHDIINDPKSGYPQAARYAYALSDEDKPKYILSCDFEHFYLREPATDRIWTTTLQDFVKNINIFNFLSGYEQIVQQKQVEVNKKAAESISAVYNSVLEAGVPQNAGALLMTRIVFALFADDTGIFSRNGVFFELLSNTKDDGSDLLIQLINMFNTLNTPDSQWLAKTRDFTYINGGLFAMDLAKYTTNLGVKFDKKIRQSLIDAATFDWSKVSPVIFGSMFEGALDPEKRHDLGAHFTSETNILKVVDSLFMNSLRQKYREASHKPIARNLRIKALEDLHDEITGLRFLDPACGSGNFLIVAYRELRRLEHDVLEALLMAEATKRGQTKYDLPLGFMENNIKVEVSQFYGIEIQGYAVSIARVGMWLMDHLMDIEASQIFGQFYTRIPLHNAANIAQANALTNDWIRVFDDDENSGDVNEKFTRLDVKNLTFIFGNPPFIGKSTMNPDQKQDLMGVLGDKIKNWKSLDFVSGWYAKALELMHQNHGIRAALVSTNSICQGEQAISLWPFMFNNGAIINFAHQTFKWDNNGAAVFVVIVGFSLEDMARKMLFEYADIKGLAYGITVPTINEYLQPDPPLNLKKSTKQISGYPEMRWGSKLTDNQNFLFERSDAIKLVKAYPVVKSWLHRYYSARELINNDPRVALYLADVPASSIRQVSPVMERIKAVQEFRSRSKKRATREKAITPTLYQEDHVLKGNFLAIPRVSSQRRDYVPMGFLQYPDLVSDSMFEVKADEFLFAILQSRMHQVWLRHVGGRLKGDLRYSNTLIYNTFVIPKAPESVNAKISTNAHQILKTRQQYIDLGQTLADLYDPLLMPASLRKFHKKNDELVDSLYGLNNPSDTQRFSRLSDLYRQGTE